MAQKTFNIKRGTSIRFRPSTITSEQSGELIPLTGFEISSSLRDDNGQLLANPIITVQENEFYSESVDTANFPYGKVLCDIKFVKNGEVVFSPTIVFNIEREQTA